MEDEKETVKVLKQASIIAQRPAGPEPKILKSV